MNRLLLDAGANPLLKQNLWFLGLDSPLSLLEYAKSRRSNEKESEILTMLETRAKQIQAKSTPAAGVTRGGGAALFASAQTKEEMQVARLEPLSKKGV